MKPPKKSIEDRNKWMYNRGVKENDAIHGAWNDKNYPYRENRDERDKKILFFINERILENRLRRFDSS